MGAITCPEHRQQPGRSAEEAVMMKLSIPGYGEVHLEHLVLDYNGTLACDGVLLPGVGEKLRILSNVVEVHVVTADTFGKVKEELDGLPCSVVVIPEENQGETKRDFVKNLGSESVVSIGNGRNDGLMLQEAALGIALIQQEGASTRSLQAADVVARSISDALELLLKPLRLTATLRS